MNYTKGEWRAYVGYTFTMVKSAEPIAVIHSDNDEADAHLIAAAPEMYEALQFIINADDSIAPDMAEVINKALAKAEGRKI